MLSAQLDDDDDDDDDIFGAIVSKEFFFFFLFAPSPIEYESFLNRSNKFIDEIFAVKRGLIPR